MTTEAPAVPLIRQALQTQPPQQVAFNPTQKPGASQRVTKYLVTQGKGYWAS